MLQLGTLPSHDNKEVQSVPGVSQVTATAKDPESHHLYHHLQRKEDVDEGIEGLWGHRSRCKQRCIWYFLLRQASVLFGVFWLDGWSCCQSSQNREKILDCRRLDQNKNTTNNQIGTYTHIPRSTRHFGVLTTLYAFNTMLFGLALRFYHHHDLKGG